MYYIEVKVSVAAMKSFQIIVTPQSFSSSSIPPQTSLHAPPNVSPTKDPSLGKRKSPSPSPISVPHEQEVLQDLPGHLSLWIKAWDTWVSIGERLVVQRVPSPKEISTLLQSHKSESLNAMCSVVPSQTLLVSFLEVLLKVYPHVQHDFTESHYQTMSKILKAALLMIVSKDVSPFLVPSFTEHSLSSVQRLILKSLGCVVTTDSVLGLQDQENNQSDEPDEGKLVHTLFGKKKSDLIDPMLMMKLRVEVGSPLIINVLSDLLSNTAYTHQLPEIAQLVQGIPPTKLPIMSVNFVSFGLASQALAVKLYRSCLRANPRVQLPLNTHENFLKVLHPPLQLRHHCSHSSVWSQSVQSLLLVLEVALPCILEEDDVATLSFWLELGAIFEDFLFSEIPEGITLSSDKMRENEVWDIKIIDVIKRDILSISTRAPEKFREKLTSILNRGSIHSAADQFNGNTSRHGSGQFRENFARACFEALLQFSFIHSKDSSSLAADSTGQLALNALLERCEEVLLKFVADERLSGSCPLPRTRMNEVSLVLKSVTILISTLKDAQRSSAAMVDRGVWRYVTKLYPALVQCITCKSPDVRHALKDTLSQFSDLLQQPTSQQS